MRHLALLLLPVVLSGAACSDASSTDAAPSFSSVPLPSPSIPTEPPSTETSTATSPVTTPTPAAAAAAAWREVVDDALDRYGAVLTELVADPPALLRPDADLAARWRAVVVDGALSDDITGRAFDRLHQDRMVILPGPDGRAYRHVVVDVGPVDDEDRPDHLSFTWCGYSPGVGVHVDTGEVLDDEVAHARGTGTVRLVGDVWQLETLDQFQLDLLGPGAADPCRSG